MTNKKISAFTMSILTLFLIASVSFAAEKEKVNPVLEAWSHESFFREKDDQSLKIKVTYYSNEYVEALIQDEAEKNLWTNDEMENYKYTLLKNLNLDECIPFHVDMYVRGIPMYAGPFDKHIHLRVGKKVYDPVDYDKRFNFKILGARDGMVYFPKYDPKTGKDILEGASEIRLILDNSISYAITSGKDVVWIWNLKKDRGSITGGKAVDRLEIDRLIKRSNKIKTEREALQKQLNELNSEYETINSRIDELQSK